MNDEVRRNKTYLVVVANSDLFINLFRGFLSIVFLATFVCLAFSSTNVDVTGYCDNMKYEFGTQYTCFVTEFYVDGPDYVVYQGRTKHLPGKSQTDVEAVHIEDQYVKYLPKRMEALFVNMITYRVENSRLEVLGNFNFDKKLKYLHLDNNMIKEVPKDIFRETVDIEWISMNENQIETLDQDLFRNMQRLRVVAFGGNRLRRLSGEMFMNNGNLEYIYFNNNGMASVGVDLVKRLTKLKVANFDSNTCINDSYFYDTSVIENLTRQFTNYCSGQCDNMINVDTQIKNLMTRNNEIVQQNRLYKASKRVNCQRQRMISSSSDSSDSSE